MLYRGPTGTARRAPSRRLVSSLPDLCQHFALADLTVHAAHLILVLHRVGERNVLDLGIERGIDNLRHVHNSSARAGQARIMLLSTQPYTPETVNDTCGDPNMHNDESDTFAMTAFLLHKKSLPAFPKRFRHRSDAQSVCRAGGTLSSAGAAHAQIAHLILHAAVDAVDLL